MGAYVELQVTSNFSFLRGASHPDELVLAAAQLGHPAIAITDRNSLAGIVRAHMAAKQVDIRLVVGCRLDLTDAPSLLCLPTDRAAYGRLARLLTLGKRRAAKATCRLTYEDVLAHGEGQILIALAPDAPGPEFAAFLDRFGFDFRRQAWLAASCLYRGDDARRLDTLAALAAAAGLPLVATNDVHAHCPWRQPLQDVLTCIREGCTIDEAGFRLFANAERHLKPAAEMARLFAAHPAAVERTLEIAERCRFSLDEIRYDYPDEIEDGRSPQEELARRVAAGARTRYPEGVPTAVEAQLRHELELIGRMDYARYFLTVHDIVRFAESRGILCQGRGSAANSAVCYCLGITAIDPVRGGFLFERFISAARNEPPDIDVDFEHERREEVIQWIYGKYGRDRAALAATVIHYRARAAIRDVGKALGLSEDVTGAISGTVWGRGRDGFDENRIREAGLDPSDPRLRLALQLSRELIGFPRHLSQHVGGFVITKGPLSEIVPIENAAMPERTVIEWDKDDLDALGILKVDILALGMLTCVRKAFELIARHGGPHLTLATVPAEVPEVYDMLGRADSLGVFQVESRAQMTMLPRLKPRCFYDLVIEVAIVRPGPIQGDMVHPYLRRRQGKEPVEMPPALEPVLAKTLGVPLFQEQAMKIAIVAAGFSPEDADRLRRAMATFRHVGTVHTFRERFIQGMIANGYDPEFAQRCFKQIEGFGTYGFPESHAASFALLVYVSAWLKCVHPAAFAAALLNSQPMGFYAPAQIARDAREHGVEVRPVDVNHSRWDCTLETVEGMSSPALRLGFRQVKGLAQRDAERIVAARGPLPYPDIETLWRRSGVSPAALERLAEADAFGSLDLDRRRALWAVRRLGDAPLPLFSAAGITVEGRPEPTVALPVATRGEEVLGDYASLRLSLKDHPLALLRAELTAEGIVPARDLAVLPPNGRATVAGLVLVRQRPGTASGVIFMTLEDETGVANLVVWPQIFERFRRPALRAVLMVARGRLQREGEVIHLVADRLADRSDRLRALAAGVPRVVARAGDGQAAFSRRAALPRSRDFH